MRAALPFGLSRTGAACVGAAGLVYVAHASLFHSWIVDDAGISFAYARSLATGHGLVAQPGAAPVEGFSNPLWTLLLASCFGLGLFDPLWTPKLLGLGFVLATVAVIGGACSRPRACMRRVRGRAGASRRRSAWPGRA
jgi:hypothetical protein